MLTGARMKVVNNDGGALAFAARFAVVMMKADGDGGEMVLSCCG